MSVQPLVRPPLQQDIELAIKEMRAGSTLDQGHQFCKTRKQALGDFAVRCPTGPVTEFIASLIQAEDCGNPVTEVLQVQAGVSRMRRSVKAASKAVVKMLGPLFMLFACIMLLVMGPMLLSLSEQDQ